MRIGINLVGVSFDDNGNLRGRNWVLTYWRIMQRVVNCWLNSNNEVYVYLTTYYYSPQKNNIYDTKTIVDSYKPKKFQFFNLNEIDSDGNETQLNQIFLYKKSFEQLIGEDLDIIVTTRFDILFHQDITKYNIDFKKLNVLFKEKDSWDVMFPIPEKNNEYSEYRATSDALFIFPYEMIHDMMKICDDKIIYLNSVKNPEHSLHDVYRRMINLKGDSYVNLMSDDICFSFNDETNTHYSLIRLPTNIK